MPATRVVHDQLILTVDGESLECQVAGTGLTWADDQGEVIRTACPDGVVTVPPPGTEPVATLTLDLVQDWQDTGPSFTLAQARGTVVPFTLNLDTDKPAHARTYDGTLRVPGIPDEVVVGAVERVSLELPVFTIDGPTRYTA